MVTYWFINHSIGQLFCSIRTILLTNMLLWYTIRTHYATYSSKHLPNIHYSAHKGECLRSLRSLRHSLLWSVFWLFVASWSSIVAYWGHNRANSCANRWFSCLRMTRAVTGVTELSHTSSDRAEQSGVTEQLTHKQAENSQQA